MADIAMLLLIFFMSTSIIRSREARGIRLPGAVTGEPVRRESAIRVTLGSSGEVALNDARLGLDEVGAVLARKLHGNAGLTISLHADAGTPYATVARLLDELKVAHAPSVSLAAERKEAR